MSIRVVLHAEGAGEAAGIFTMPPAPGTPLSEEHLGPAHLLARRALAEARSAPEAAIHFDSPLRTRRGRVARGSDLLDRETLRQFFAWPARRPDLIVVLVDADGDPRRKRELESHVEGLTIPSVIAVAVQEFESWLLADQQALNQVVGSPVAKPTAIEEMARREAKQLLAGILGERNAAAARRAIALTCDLEVVARECSSFGTFQRELKAT